MDCDASNSGPLPSVQWFNPQGVLVSNDRDLVIDDIQRDAAGVYTCTATSTDDGETLNTTATVTVQCECVSVCVRVCVFVCDHKCDILLKSECFSLSPSSPPSLPIFFYFSLQLLLM